MKYYGINGVPLGNGSYGRIKNITDPNGARFSTTYDAVGRPLTIIDSLGNLTSKSYNNIGTIGTQHIKTDLPLNQFTSIYIDGLGREIKTESTAANNQIVKTETQYN